MIAVKYHVLVSRKKMKRRTKDKKRKLQLNSMEEQADTWGLIMTTGWRRKKKEILEIQQRKSVKQTSFS